MSVLLNLFITFAKIGMFTIGGGYAMIPLIQQEILRHSWLTMEGIIDVIAISEMTPGPFAINAATFIGFKKVGFIGALFATAGVICPSYIFMIAIAKYFTHFREKRVVQAILSGLRPAVIGLIASAVVLIARSTLINSGLDSGALIKILDFLKWRNILIFITAIIVIIKYDLHPALVICICGILGIVLYSIF